MSARSSLTLVTPVDSSPSGSSVHGILQARMLEWVAILSSSTSSQPRDRTYMSYVSSIDRPLALLRKPFIRASLIAQVVKNLSAMQETLVWFQGWEEYSWASLVAQLIKNPSAMQEPGFNPWVGKIPWRRERLPKYSGLENSRYCIVHEVAKSWTQLSNRHFHSLSFIQVCWKQWSQF